MTKRTFRTDETKSRHQGVSPAELVQRPVAVYYRQSTVAQIGNVSTTIQTIDLVDEMEKRGWNRKDIFLIDDDEGVSGTKRIDERTGMSFLFELITDNKIGAVACQDEDRLFRDLTQIQVNIFIDVCRRADVKVITPYFTYDFADPLQGEFHARQFRFKCDMAADYLKTYVLGRLAPARQRLLKLGLWAGARMPVGYMVDMRKKLPDGTDNPNWRKFTPFEPFAEIVRTYYRIFNECGGAIRQSLRRIRDEKIYFPDCDPPEGFKAVYQLKNRGEGRYLTRNNFVLCLTNPVYLGHWCYKGVVHQWNNHPPLVDPETFATAFNALSRFTLTGEANDEYRPAYQYVPRDETAKRPDERPLLSGLLFTTIEDKSYRASVIFEPRNHCYLYTLNKSDIFGLSTVWVRRSSWVDEAVVTRFKQKLVATFNSDVWTQVVEDTQQVIERERKLKRSQLFSISEEMQNLVASLRVLTHPILIKEVEQRYERMEQEQARLQSDLANLELRQQQHFSVDQARRLFHHAVENWNLMTQEEQRLILSLFIDRIVASEYTRAGDMRLEVYWKDASSEVIQLWHKSHSDHWTPTTVERLLSLFDANATQLEIAEAFPGLKWYQIFNELKKHRGLVRFTPSWLGKSETYEDYLRSGGRKGKASGSHWREEEIETLKGLVQSQATQLEIMQAFPYRRWVYIKGRIKVLFGKEVRVPLSGISQRLTYIEYAQQKTTSQTEPDSRTGGRNS